MRIDKKMNGTRSAAKEVAKPGKVAPERRCTDCRRVIRWEEEKCYDCIAARRWAH